MLSLKRVRDSIKGPQTTVSEQLLPEPQKIEVGSNYGKNFSELLRKNTTKVAKLAISTQLLSYFDSTNPVKNLHVNSIEYQVASSAAIVALTLLSLEDKSWSKLRNAANSLLIPTAAVAFDYGSIVDQLHRIPAVLPKKMFMWRDGTFHSLSEQIPGVQQFINWIDAPSKLIHGMIQGYDTAIYGAMAFAAVQVGYYFLDRRSEKNSKSTGKG